MSGMIRFIVLLLLFASPATAQSYETRSTDILLDATVLSGIILGRDLEFFDGGISRYSPGGSYSWTYAENNGGGNWYGTHQISADGTVCIEFRTLRGRCDMFVQAGDRLVLLTENGQRYPVRNIR